MNKMKTVYLSVLVAANIIIYATPLAKSTDINNFDLKGIEGRKQLGGWRVVRDIGASEMEIKGLPGSKIVRYALANDKGREAQFVLVVNNFRTSIHTPTACLPAQGWIIESMKTIPNTEAGDHVPVNSIVTHFQKGGLVRRELVWYWYAVYENNFTSHFGAVLYNAFQRALYGRKYNWALIRFSTQILGPDGKAEMDVMKDLLKNTYPIIKEMKDSVR